MKFNYHSVLWDFSKNKIRFWISESLKLSSFGNLPSQYEDLLSQNVQVAQARWAPAKHFVEGTQKTSTQVLVQMTNATIYKQSAMQTYGFAQLLVENTWER